MKASYLASPARKRKRKSALPLALLTVFFALFMSLGGALAFTAQDTQETQAADPVQFVMCMFDEETVPRMVYQATQTSDLNFAVQSKSAITAGQEDVVVGPVGLNWLLSITMGDFQERNEAILGQSLDGFEGDSAAEEEREPGEYNKGDRMTPFDRFGVAGLTWSSYAGEWKYVQVDACAVEGSEPTDPKAGMFYEERLEPRSTYEDIPKTKDVRTAQFAKGSGLHYINAFVNLFANAVFFLTKLIVVLTVTFINFSFTDLTSVMGLQELLAGGDNSIFGVLYNGVFTPLILLVFFLTAVWVFWNGIVNKQIRTSLGGLLRSITLFIVAVVVAFAPAFFIGLPNQVAVVLQSVVAGTMSTGLAGGNGICTVDGQQSRETALISNPNADEQNILNQASASMQSAISCQLWQAFLLKPWSEGQFGVDWSQVWADGKTPSWTSGATDELTNTNGPIVGEADVPLGNDTTLHNWALFQLSTQTNAHSPLGHQGELSKYTSGVANDWWRIVDATSNYNEVTTKVNNDFLGSVENSFGDAYVEVEIQEPDANSTPTDVWDSWVGNSPWNRMGVAFTSIAAAGIGVAAPLVFGAMAAVYSLGISILMAFAPIMLLFGCWAGKGWEIFKGWAELLIDTTVKRVVVGLLLILSIILVSTVLNLMDDQGYWWGIIALIIVSAVLIKSRERIMSMAAAIFSFKFSSVDFGSSARTFSNKTAGRVTRGFSDVTKLGTGLAAGAIGAKAAGGTFAEGARLGAQRELENRAYRSKGLREVLTSYEAHTSHEDLDLISLGHQYCAACGMKLAFELDQDSEVFIGGRDGAGRLLCKDCFESGEGGSDAREYIARRRGQDTRDNQALAKDSDLRESDSKERLAQVRQASSADLGRSQDARLIKRTWERYSASDTPLTSEALEKLSAPSTAKSQDTLGALVGRTVARDKALFDKSQTDKGGAVVPAIPKQFQPYLQGEEALIARMWQEGNQEAILYIYAAAALKWFYEQHDYAEPGSLTPGQAPSEEFKLIHAQASEAWTRARSKGNKD